MTAVKADRAQQRPLKETPKLNVFSSPVSKVHILETDLHLCDVECVACTLLRIYCCTDVCTPQFNTLCSQLWLKCVFSVLCRAQMLKCADWYQRPSSNWYVSNREQNRGVGGNVQPTSGLITSVVVTQLHYWEGLAMTQRRDLRKVTAHSAPWL